MLVFIYSYVYIYECLFETMDLNLNLIFISPKWMDGWTRDVFCAVVTKDGWMDR